MVIALFGLLLGMFLFFVGLLLFDSESGLAMKLPERPKVKKLKARINELEGMVELLDKKNAELSTELIARRNGLAWVEVKELDGPQE